MHSTSNSCVEHTKNIKFRFIDKISFKDILSWLPIKKYIRDLYALSRYLKNMLHIKIGTYLINSPFTELHKRI